MNKVDLSANFCGIKSPNPFWLASAPPTNSAQQIERAFEAGWGGAVWKTLTSDHIVNVGSRYGGLDLNGARMAGFNNIELISDRDLKVSLQEISQVKKRFPDHAIIVSIMQEMRRESWHEIVKMAQDAGADGLELNFGCPHGMNERGMGSVIGQVPEYTTLITSWVKEIARIPVIVKLTPNVADIRFGGRAAREGGADAISLINTINSIIGVDLDTLQPIPQVAGKGSHGGYSGPAVKPIALNMVHQICSDAEIKLPVSGIGGIATWSDAVEFMLLGASTVQICTAVMHYGFRLIDELQSGLSDWMQKKGFDCLDDFVGASVNSIGKWSDLDLGYRQVSEIDQQKCIHCGLCYIGCEDGAHQSITKRQMNVDEFVNEFPDYKITTSGRKIIVPGAGAGYLNIFEVDEEKCVGCNLCSLVCPVPGCITMSERDPQKPRISWDEYQARLENKSITKFNPPR
jgi:dihydropyrimidine dehydrogenase (NAD+) subunit PreA